MSKLFFSLALFFAVFTFTSCDDLLDDFDKDKDCYEENYDDCGCDDSDDDDDREVNIPVSQLPQTILDYVTENYPNLTITEAEVEYNRSGDVVGYEIELSNELELYFDAEGNLIRKDSDDDGNDSDDSDDDGNDSDSDDSDDDSSDNSEEGGSTPTSNG